VQNLRVAGQIAVEVDDNGSGVKISSKKNS